VNSFTGKGRKFAKGDQFSSKTVRNLLKNRGDRRTGNFLLAVDENSLMLEGDAASDFEKRAISCAFDKWDGVGGYAEVIPKDLSYLLDSLFYSGPIPMRLGRCLDQTTLFGQHAQGYPSLIWLSISAILKAKLRIVQCFKLCAVANLNPLVTQERNFDIFPSCRARAGRLGNHVVRAGSRGAADTG